MPTTDHTEAMKHHARQLRAMARALKARARIVNREALNLERFTGDTAADRRAARDAAIRESRESGNFLALRYGLTKGRVSQIRQSQALRQKIHALEEKPAASEPPKSA